MKRIVAALVFSLVAVVAGAVTLENNRFVLRQGENYPMLVYDQNADVCFEVRSVGMQGWYVVAASARGTCYVASATLGEQVLDAAFEHQTRSIDSAPQSVFRFQFLWRYQEYGKPPLEHYGWVTLTIDREGGIVIVASQVADVHGLAVVGECEPGGWKPIDDETGGEEPGGDEPSEPLTFKVVNHGDWVELAPRCIPEGTKGYIEIPDYIDGKPVRAIGEDAFYGRTGITSVSYSWMVGSIGYKSFCSCSGLRRIAIPESVTNIDACAFSFSGIGEADVGGGVRMIREETFYGCSNLSNVTLCAGVEVIGTNAFGSCLSLKSVTIPQSVERIESGAFKGTSLKTVQVPYTTIIEEDAFDSNTKIVRYGPDISSDVTLRECEKPTLMRLLGAETLRNARTVSVRPEFDKEKEIEPQEPIDAARVCVQLGITPVRVEVDGKGVCVDAYFRVPKIQIVKFDPAARSVRGRVIPAEGSRIAEPPQEYVFVLYYHYPNGVGGFGIKDIYCPFDERNYALLDLSDYTKTGEFTFTYTEDLVRGDVGGLFSIGISNDYYGEW